MMADPSRLRRKSGTLGSPPPSSEASSNLSAPEAAPAPPPEKVPVNETSRKKNDGRSLRRTGRTVQFATRVTPEFDVQLRDIAARDRMLIVEVLERALAAYEHNRK